MEILLDTHAFLWYLFDDSRLSRPAALAIDKPDNTKCLSMASLWEMAIKVQLGKLGLGVDFQEFIERNVTSRLVEVLTIELSDVVTCAGLPLHHRDPFDRMIIGHSINRNIPVVTMDERFASYDLRTIW